MNQGYFWRPEGSLPGETETAQQKEWGRVVSGTSPFPSGLGGLIELNVLKSPRFTNLILWILSLVGQG